MAQNFTEMVQPFLRVVKPAQLEDPWNILNLVPKALVGIFLFPDAVPEPALYHMNIVTFLFYFYCTQHIQQCAISFFLMSLCFFVMYRRGFIRFLSPCMLVIVTFYLPGSEFSLDALLQVSLSYWLVKKSERDKLKTFFLLWFCFIAFCLPTMKFFTERKAVNASISENILNATGSNISTTDLILEDEL